MANFNIKGLDKLNTRLDSMGQAPDRLKKQLINQGANIVLDQMKSDAPKGDGGSYKHLSIVDSRSGKNYLFLDIGINYKNWDQCRGLYFQNYDGERSAGRWVQWIDRSFGRSKPKARKVIRDGIKGAILK